MVEKSRTARRLHWLERPVVLIFNLVLWMLFALFLTMWKLMIKLSWIKEEVSMQSFLNFIKDKGATEKSLTFEDVCKEYFPNASDREVEFMLWAGLMKLKRRGVVVKFELGSLVVTRGVADLMAESEQFTLFCSTSIMRHSNGDWGDLCAEDVAENNFALDKHLRLLSAYESSPMWKIWIITEADRSITTVLFPDEY